MQNYCLKNIQSNVFRNGFCPYQNPLRISENHALPKNHICIYTKFELQYLSMLLTQKSEKSSVSSHISDLSSQFSVLSAQFSVLSSLGEEYTDNKYSIVENFKRVQTSALRRSVPFVVRAREPVKTSPLKNLILFFQKTKIR